MKFDPKQAVEKLRALRPEHFFASETPDIAKMERVEPPSGTLFIALSLGFAVLVMLLFFIEVEAVVTGEGAVETESGIQPIETQEGGIIDTVSVVQGQRVEANQEIAVISNTTILAARIDIQNELDLLRVKEYRLGVERAGGRDFRWPDNLKDLPEMLRGDQYDLFVARQQSQNAALQAIALEIESLQKELTGAENELGAMQAEHETVKKILDFQMEGFSKGWVSKSDALRSQNQYAQIAREMVKTESRIPTLLAQIEEARKKLHQTRSEQQQQTLDELEEITLRIRSLEASIDAATDKDQRRSLRAPRAGIINTIHVSGPGDVVQPGEPIVDLVPSDQGQIIEARIDPSLRRGLYVGLPAKVTFSALQDLRIPPIDGEVIFVAADTLTDPKGIVYYEIHVRTNNDVLVGARGQTVEIESGMQASVSIVVGSHTLIDFLLRPLYWAVQNAFRER